MAVFASPSKQSLDVSSQVTRPIAILTYIVAVVMFLITPVLAFDWAQHIPFAGVLLGPNQLVSDATGNGWGPTDQLALLDRVVAVDGVPVIGQAELEQLMVDSLVRAPSTTRFKIDRSPYFNTLPCAATNCEVGRVVRRFEVNDFLRLFGLPYGIGLIYLMIGLWVLRQRGNQRTGQALAFFCAVTAVILVGYFDQMSTNVLTPVYMLALGLISGALLNLALIFPQSPRLLDRLPLLRFAGYVPGLVAAVFGIAGAYNPADPWGYIEPQRWMFIFIAVAALFYFLSLIYRFLKSDSPIVRQQSRIILFGSLAAFIPLIIWIVQGLFDPNAPFNPLLTLPLMFSFPFAVAYAMLRYHLLNFDKVVTGGITYFGLSLLAVTAYLALVAGLSVLIRSETSLAGNPILLIVFILLVIIVFDVLRQRLNRWIDRIFFHGRLDTQQVLQTYSRSLTEVADMPMIVTALRRQVTDMHQPERLYVFLLDPRQNAFVAQPDPQMPRLPALAAQCAIDSAIPHWLKSENGPHYLQESRALPAVLQPDQVRLEAIGAVLYVPLIGRDRINGWLAMGHRHNAQPYTTEDLNFLAALANQTALALERAIVFEDLQRRVNELNALSRISQAVNFTLGTDDILELIYAQTSRVLDTRNFYIAMADEKRTSMCFSFYVEGNDRLYPDDMWPIDTGLSGLIMKNGQPIVTDDYVAECERRGVPPGGRPGKAWMGVPLNASNEPMGIMAVTDFRDEVTYSPEQLQVFAAIADQAASVLYKSQLYRQTEERARQLAALNEVGSSLTSTLDLRTVLETIVAKAIELLHAEAGSLLLVDENTNELVFEVTFGPAAEDLRGQRLPIGKGIVGAVAQTRQPQIVNEAQTDSRWLRDVDKATAFITRAILAVPMVTKDRVIGVIEVINTRDADQFTLDDQHLLAAFAINAAVAVDNARLFTMTDRALASRLDELSTLQEIDRQLNASLDIRRVLDLTLDWGLRVTEAHAGSVGIVNRADNVVELAAARNYSYQPASLPADQGLAGAVVRTGQPILLNDVSQDQRYIAAAPGTRSQLSVPIKRENTVIGVLNLESNKPDAFGIFQLDTATRLADHAAIAITNAQLYQEVKHANDAKSEFVSIVSHELKTPMTSMKGYTDLLVKGMAGPVSDMQAQFLNVIRANVDRMGTLVNDLLEVSRIETGRLKLDVKPLELDIAIDDTLRTAKAQIEERQQTLELRVPEGLPPVLADRSRVIQVLTNLISNAYKYTPSGGHLTIEVSHQQEPLPAAARVEGVPATRLDANFVPNPAGYLWCAIIDSGVGIAPEDMSKLFTKFFRSGDPAVREQPGTGLGLSITRSLIELQGGAIWVSSEVGTGSTFAFSVPVTE